MVWRCRAATRRDSRRMKRERERERESVAMESVAGRVAVMVVIGVVGGILAIQVLKSGVMIPDNNSSSSSTNSSSSIREERRHAELLNSNHGEETREVEEEAETEDEKESVEEKEMFRNLLNKLVYVLKSVSPQKIEAGEGDTRAKVIKRYRRETMLNERNVFNESLKTRIRHPRHKLHHRNFDRIFPTLVKEGKNQEEKEKEMKISQSYPDRPGMKLHQRNFDNIVPTLVRGEEEKEEKEKEIMKNITKTDHGESKAVQKINNKLAFHLHQTTDYANSDANGTISLANAENNVTEFVKMTKLTSLDLQLPVLLVCLFVVLLAMFSLMYTCYFCMSCLRRKKEQKKGRPFTIS